MIYPPEIDTGCRFVVANKDAHVWDLTHDIFFDLSTCPRVKQDACQNDRGIENTWIPAAVWLQDRLLRSVALLPIPNLECNDHANSLSGSTPKNCQNRNSWSDVESSPNHARMTAVSLTSGMSPLNPLLLGLGVSRKPDISMSIL